jgi:hypothetical protein
LVHHVTDRLKKVNLKNTTDRTIDQ